ncbi:DegT/DnrJ/EryC1/StrS family aminotransferase [Bradyrhizobium sp. WBAH42]|nr:aminotransferase DegT [Bradyrhizobium sp. WBAH30]MDD1542220.1 aminotransferase DegT [Bradyrhizobium sp. WBAH41]MDD1556372.1 aminotransferase DegT [Bradyrhizobium sp. WBAH23]MDD1561787.1 aminotransferase DegT [Bradyrhizobium sp. WBAH33]MDD1589191.1 aminotransferase DegT [Bradyrhizobium sp. WBAH42]NRB87689.1 aminotransferase DegT [Bradyrhizobium sp. WBAH10]QCJ94298.1 aminotransferase DegT [Bradyrhizobium yuanmingense]
MENFIPISRPSIGQREEELIMDAVRSGWVSSMGRYIDEFEAVFARYCGTEFAIAVSNGTTGLHLALATLDLGPGDEVIIPDLTFVATANAVAYTGAKPVLADIDPVTLCIDPSSVNSLITKRTKAVIAVHLYGHPADMDSLAAIADANGISLIEDAAEAHGAEYKGRRVGSLSRCGVFSFYGNKIVTTGEGGMLTTNDRAFYKRAKRLRDHAMSSERRYFHEELGYNYRMTNLQAALGVAQMERIDEFLEQRAKIMAWYHSVIPTGEAVRLNKVRNWAKSAFWMVCLEVDSFNEQSRNAFMSELKNMGIDSRPYFYTISSLPMYRQQPLPISLRKSRTGLNLPSFCELTQKDVERVGRAVADLLKQVK